MSISRLAGQYIEQAGKGDSDEESVSDIITFAEASWGLNMNLKTGSTELRPVQKFILKAYYNLQLDNTQKNIIVRDYLNEVEKYKFTEVEYLNFLYNEGRTNIKEITDQIRNELVLVCGRRGGKCLEKQTLILTPEGPVEIQNIKVGDTVYGYNKDGSVSECKVKAKKDQGVQEVVELINHNRVFAACTFNHKWLVVDERGKNLKEISPKEFKLRHGQPKAQIVRKFVKIPCGKINEPHAYALGAFLGDGCSRQGSWKTLDVSSDSDHVPEKIASVLKAGICFKQHKNNFTWRIRNLSGINCNHYDDWCKDRYAHEKIVNLEIIKTWNRKSCLEFLAGLIDTDGSVYRTKNDISLHFCGQSKSIVEAFQYLILKLFQYQAKIGVDKRKKYKNGPVYNCKLKNNFFVKMILEELEPHLAKPSRKWKKEWDKECTANNSNPDFVGVKLGKRYKAQTYDIEVDNETNLYVLANQGMVTHNSKLSSIISCYETYKLIRKTHPQKYYGVGADSEIYITVVATSTDQAQLLFNDIAGSIDNARFFDRYKSIPTVQYMKLKTPHDLTKNADSKPTLIIQASPCSARGLRGMSNIVVIMDEQAHYIDNSSNKSDSAVYDAVTPSTLSFGKEARTINISSPLNKQGKLWELYNQSFKSEKILMFQIPTWEMYPGIDSSELREKYRRNPAVYFCEIGGQFSDTVKSWMPVDQLKKCIDPNLKPKLRGKPNTIYFMGIDIGLKNDPTAISVLHIEPVKKPIYNSSGNVIDEIVVPKYELDKQIILQAGKNSKKDKNIDNTVVTSESISEFLDFEIIGDNVEQLAKDFYVEKGLFDQYTGPPLMQNLTKRGFTQFEMTYFDRRFSSEIYNNFLINVIDEAIILYDDWEDKQIEEGKHGPFISEIIDLQSQFISKYITIVQAPEVEGKHDDRCDSYVRALWCATQYLNKNSTMFNRSVTNQMQSANNNMSSLAMRYHKFNHRHSPERRAFKRESPYSVFTKKIGGRR